jgi:hypothetical protein
MGTELPFAFLPLSSSIASRLFTMGFENLQGDGPIRNPIRVYLCSSVANFLF